MTRVLTAAVLLPLFILAVLAANPLVFTALVMVAAALCAAEMERIATASGVEALPFVGSLWALGFLCSAAWPEAFRLDAVTAAGFVALLGFVLFGKRPLAEAFTSSACACFTALYTGYLLGFGISVRNLPDALGPRLIFLMAVIVFTGDSAAYYVGRAFGRHKLAPRVSPGKTWEGAFANVAGGLLGAAVAHLTFFPELRWADAVALGLLLSVIGQMGDLFESALKRGAGVKDSGSILPGHGGMLDRLDSMIVSGPALYFYHQAFMA